jgi:SAM-dependent methyltransferase
MVFSEVRFSEEEMHLIYSDYRTESYITSREIFEPGYREINDHLGKSPEGIAARNQTLLNFFKPHINTQTVRRVLDFGGDQGQFIPTEFQSEKYVYEISDVAVLEGITKISSKSSLHTSGEFDLIICSNVLEHLPYPSEALREMRAVATKDAFFFFDVPYDMPGQHPTFFHEHINYFSINSMRALLKTNGFLVIKQAQIDKSIYVLAKLNAL